MLFIAVCSHGQEIGKVKVVSYEDVFEDIDDKLTYLDSDESLYTGFIQHKRKNGRLVQEEYVEKGHVIYWQKYFRGKNDKPAIRVEYHYGHYDAPKKYYEYNKDGRIRRITWYDVLFNKQLVEEYENGKLTYSCEYNGRKKHGEEFCFNAEGNKITTVYRNGKKIRN